MGPTNPGEVYFTDATSKNGVSFMNNVFVATGTGPGKDAIYGRKITVEQPNNGGRTLGAFYFVNGKLIVLESTILPANGDYASPDPGRFIDSVVFQLQRTQQGATELKLPE